MLDKEFYTKLIYEHKYQEDFGPERITFEETAWDCDLTRMLNMFHGLMISAGYQEESWKRVLEDYLVEMYDATVTYPSDEKSEDIDDSIC